MNWQGLLNWSIQTQGEYKTDTSLKPLNKEERAWLEEAIGEYNIDIVGEPLPAGQRDESLDREHQGSYHQGNERNCC